MHPLSINGGGFDHGQLDHVLINRLHLCGRRSGVGRNDKCVGQGVAVEHGNEVLVEVGLQLFQAFLLADESDFVEAGITFQQVADGIAVGFGRVGFHIERDLRRLVEFA